MATSRQKAAFFHAVEMLDFLVVGHDYTLETTFRKQLAMHLTAPDGETVQMTSRGGFPVLLKTTLREEAAFLAQEARSGGPFELNVQAFWDDIKRSNEIPLSREEKVRAETLWSTVRALQHRSIMEEVVYLRARKAYGRSVAVVLEDGDSDILWGAGQAVGFTEALRQAIAHFSGKLLKDCDDGLVEALQAAGIKPKKPARRPSWQR